MNNYYISLGDKFIHVTADRVAVNTDGSLVFYYRENDYLPVKMEELIRFAPGLWTYYCRITSDQNGMERVKA